MLGHGVAAAVAGSTVAKATAVLSAGGRMSEPLGSTLSSSPSPESAVSSLSAGSSSGSSPLSPDSALRPSSSLSSTSSWRWGGASTDPLSSDEFPESSAARWNTRYYVLFELIPIHLVE